MVATEKVLMLMAELNHLQLATDVVRLFHLVI
jgi:hypothetical protein